MAHPPRILFDRSPLSEGFRIPLDRSLRHRLLRVLRLREGDPVHLCDSEGTIWEAILRRSSGDWCLETLAIGPNRLPCDAPESPPFVIAMGLLKADRTEWAVQKTTEAGVREIHVIGMRRSVPRPQGAEALRRVERLRRVAREAARQCGRSRVPDVHWSPSLEAWLPTLERWGDLPRHLLDERPGSPPLAAVLRGSSGAILVSGPEGSFEEEERRLLLDHGFQPSGLGPRILRAETAALVGLVVAQVVCGDLGDLRSRSAEEGSP